MADDLIWAPDAVPASAANTSVHGPLPLAGPGTGAALAFTWQQLQQIVSGFVNEFLRQVAVALGAIEILGFHPYEALVAIGEEIAESKARFDAIIAGLAVGDFSGLISVLQDLQAFLTSIPATLISGVTAVEQEILDAIAHALGFAGPGHTPTNIETYLTQIPGANIVGDIAASLISGVTTAQQQLQDTINQVFNPIADAGANLAALGTSLQNSLQGLLPAVVDNLDGTYTALAGLVDNLDGTFSYTPGSNPVQTLIDQGDGTWATVSEAFHQAANAATAIAGNTMTAAANAGQQAWNMLVSTFGGFSPPAATPAQAQQAVSGAASTLSSNSGSIASIQATLAALSSGGGTNATLDFSTLPDGSLPSSCTVVSGSGISVSSGAAVATNANEIVRYNAAQTQTDYQKVSGVYTATTSNMCLLGRVNSSGDTFVAALRVDGDLTTTGWKLVCVISGSVVPLAASDVIFADLFLSTGAVYTLLCGLSGGSRQFQMLKYGSPLPLISGGSGTTFTDSGNVSQLGSSYRYAGFSVGISATGLSVTGSMQMSLWNLVEGQNLSPTAFVATSEFTSSTSYTDLTTTTDQTTVTVGPSGSVWISFSAFASNNTASQGSYMTIAISGATTQSASTSDGLGQYASTAQINGQVTLGQVISNSFLLTGLTPGSTTFKLKYKASGGSSTATFLNRRLSVKVQ